MDFFTSILLLTLFPSIYLIGFYLFSTKLFMLVIILTLSLLAVTFGVIALVSNYISSKNIILNKLNDNENT